MKKLVGPCAAVAVVWLAAQVGASAPLPAQPAAEAQQILQAAGFQGGLIVDLGCGDGTLSAALRTAGNCIVQGLDAAPANVEKARARIQSLGLYGPVSANLFDGKRLPYVDNLANLVVAENLGAVPMDEVMRVLAPLGAVCVKQGGTWKATRKPWPKEIDEWPQHFHDADNNAVARDSVVGPPRHFQWVAEPEWSRSHLGLPSVTSVVSSKGRLFDIEDQAPVELPSLPGKFALVARDAFNGIVLWQRSLPVWEPVTRHTKSTPVQLQRRLAAIGDVVYCTPGFNTPVTAFDAATGTILKTYEGTQGVQEFVFDRGVLYLVIGDRMNAYGKGDDYTNFMGTAFPLPVYGPQSVNLPDPKCSIVALQADSGQKLWEISGNDTHGYQGGTLGIRGDCVAYCLADAVVCRDRASGRPMWRTPAEFSMGSEAKLMSGAAPTLVISDGAVYVADGKTVNAYALKDGAPMWAGKAVLNHHKPSDLFVAAGAVWTGALEGYDPQTGKVLHTLAQAMTGPMGHNRCYRNRVTDTYYINTATGGSDFLGLNAPGEFPDPWVRGTCGVGTTPCNGLLYAPPPACSCSNWVMLNAFNALSTEPGLKSSAQPIPVATNPRLEKGSAYGQPLDAAPADPGSWPTYRHDVGRSGATQAKPPAQLDKRWVAKVTTRASAPVIAAGKVFVADIDAHAVCALDAADGHALWRYTTGARVDSPPTYYKGLLLFGSRDGWVYCLRAADGALAWRFRGLPEDRVICAYGQLESAWPVCGSVLVKDNVAYFAAGRNSFLDGGIFLYGLDPQTGRVIHQRHMYGPYDDQGYPIIVSRTTGGSGLDGFKNDVFLTDGQLLYLRQQAFQPDLTPLKPEEVSRPHLIPSAGFLEAIPHHRTFWTIDTTIRYDIALPKGNNPYGDILVTDGKQFYEARGYLPGRTYNFNPREHGYTLFAGLYSKPGKAESTGAKAPRRAPAGADAAANKGRKNAPAPAETGPPAKRAKKKAAASPAEAGAESTIRKSPKKAAAAPEAGAAEKTGSTKAAGGSSERWSSNIPLTGKALALAEGVLFVAGTPVAFPDDDLAKAYEGGMGGVLWAVSAETGEKLAECKLDAAPAWDGMAVADGRLCLSLKDGSVVCMGAK